VAPGSSDDDERLQIVVQDTGTGVAADRGGFRRRRGVGLDNVESRLLRYYGETGQLRITTQPMGGTVVEITLAVRRRLAAAVAS
jgi:sensor histidine kinase YesM